MRSADFTKAKDWVKVWSGRWSLHSDSHFGQHFSVMNEVAGRPVYPRVLYFSRQGISDCWVRQSDKDDLGARLLRSVSRDIRKIRQVAADLKKGVRLIRTYIDNNDPRFVSQASYWEFWTLTGRHYLPHLIVKYLVDYLSPRQLEKFLPILEEARLAAEPVFRWTEDYMEAIAAEIGRQAGYGPELILSTTYQELDSYFVTGRLPLKGELRRRYHAAALMVDHGDFRLLDSARTRQLEKAVAAVRKTAVIRGNTAYPGRASGIAKLVFDPRGAAKNFPAGGILVTGMTRPEFLPLMKKASAFVTDAGGVLSHAAIVARELKKPCVIGTKNATKIIKDGDRIEVDADQGQVIINK